MTHTALEKTYYAATANPSPNRPALQGDVHADVCVIGAGYTGLSTALFLAEAGLKVVVLEAVKVGFGASGRNGGQLVIVTRATLMWSKNKPMDRARV